MPQTLYRLAKNGKPDFLLATSCTSGRPCANYTMALAESASHLRDAGLDWDYWLHSEDCHVDDARNFLAQMFLDSGAPYMMFIDDDVGWDPEGLLKVVTYKDADIVGGAYPLRQHNEDYPLRILADRPNLQARADGLLEVAGVPTGFMRISRECMQAVADKRRHLKFTPKECGPDDVRHTVIFERMMVEGKRWSGDLNFCREARQLGFKVWVDPELHFTHQGNRTWEGHLGKWLRQRAGILESGLDIAIDKLIAGDNSLENFQQIWKHYNNQFSMGPEALKAVYDHALEAKGPIFEAGSGITTIIAGIACVRTGQTVHALEHDVEWFGMVRNFVKLWKVKPVALYYAPLEEYDIADEQHKGRNVFWYEIDERLPDRFDLAIIDGPPRRYGREGIFKLFLDRIRHATWIADDSDDPNQLAMITKYAEECGKTVEDIGSKMRGKRRFAIARGAQPSLSLVGGDDDAVFSAA